MNAFSLTLILVVCCPLQNDEASIRAVMDGRAAAWEKQDVEHLVAPFAKDADYIDSSGTMTTGRDQIEAVLHKDPCVRAVQRQQVEAGSKESPLCPSDVAVVDAAWSLTGLKSSDGKPLPDRAGTSVLVLTKNGEKWGLSLCVSPSPQPSRDRLRGSLQELFISPMRIGLLTLPPELATPLFLRLYERHQADPRPSIVERLATEPTREQFLERLLPDGVPVIFRRTELMSCEWREATAKLMAGGGRELIHVRQASYNEPREYIQAERKKR